MSPECNQASQDYMGHCAQGRGAGGTEVGVARKEQQEAPTKGAKVGGGGDIFQGVEKEAEA